jgi:hypothetical protein
LIFWELQFMNRSSGPASTELAATRISLRPQLFAADDPTAPSLDLGPGILASAGGADPRPAKRHAPSAVAKSAAWRVASIGLLAVFAVCVGVQFDRTRSASRATAGGGGPIGRGPVVSTMAPFKPVDTAPARIENVAPQSPSEPQRLANATPRSIAPAPKTLHPAARDAGEAKAALATASKRSARPDPRNGAAPAASDEDTELLAAMLPHLRTVAARSSPAHERRCGGLTGPAATACYARFCNGREGVDAACPRPQAQ